MTDTRLQRILKAALVGAIPVLSICVLLPLAVYGGNSVEFAASFADLLIAVVPWVTAAVAALALPGAFLTGASWHRYLAVLAALAILVWLQGNILVWDYGVLDGRSIDWGSGAWRGVLDIAIWCLVLGVALAAYERFGKGMVIAAMGTFAIQFIAAATMLVSQAELLQATSKIELDGMSGAAIPRFSRGQNVVHIVMDGFQSDIFSDIIEDPANAELKEQLKGFTLFRDNLGAFPYTQVSIPAFLSSRLYRNEVPMDNFVADVLGGKTIMNSAFDAGYEVDIAATIPLKHIYGQGKHTHAYAITGQENATEEFYVRNDLAKVIDLSLFRVLPHFAKNLAYRDGLWYLQPIAETRVNAAVQYFADLLFLDNLAETMTVDRNVPVYKLLHVMLSHRPTVGNENCQFDGLRGTNRANVTLQATCGLKWVVKVLRRMKELGIYEDSLIVLMGDHGAWVPVRELANEDAKPPGVEPLWVGMATPLMAIKPPGASGGLEVSNAQTSVIDLPATISELIGLDAEFSGTPVFSLGNESARERRHLIYNYGKNPDAEGYLYPILEYRVTGSTLDASAWQLTAKHLPAVQNGD
ncbi:MAG: sulfatase-like hydrolase/transferase [Woeseiaceae bacterium]|nr:sulfatase-like hydrolase/transferase [Woeseiaceae bacterium]